MAVRWTTFNAWPPTSSSDQRGRDSWVAIGFGGPKDRSISAILEFTDAMRLPSTSRIWKKADLFTLLVELHRAIFKLQLTLDSATVAEALKEFYLQVDTPDLRADVNSVPGRFYKAALQATNDRSSRVSRGEIIADLLAGTVQ